MDKKILMLLSLLMMVSFCTGIFVEILTTDHASLSSETPAFLISLWENIKNDIFTVLLAFIFSITIILTPCVGILVMVKVFSLGFSAAYLLAVHEKGFLLLSAVLLPRCILRIPAYMALILISFHTAKQIKKKRPLMPSIKNYLFCLLPLLISSLIEVCLLQLVF